MYELYEAPDRRVYEQSRARVQAFACSLRSLPPRDAQSVRTVGYAERTEPAAAWSSHKSAAARLEHNGILPKLFTCPAKHAHVPFNASYEAQHALRRRGRAFPVWQFAPAGTVTLPHIDLDVNRVPLATYFVVASGEELIVAWDRNELHEDVAIRGLPSLDCLHSRKLTSLTVTCAKAGDVVYMPPNTVHMVVTTVAKCHLAYHVY